MIARENIVVTPKGKVLVDVDIPRWLEDCEMNINFNKSNDSEN